MPRSGCSALYRVNLNFKKMQLRRTIFQNDCGLLLPKGLTFWKKHGQSQPKRCQNNLFLMMSKSTVRRHSNNAHG